MSEARYLEDAYLREVETTVAAAAPGRIVLEATCFYPRGGGQPGDRGVIAFAGGEAAIVEAAYDEDRRHIIHIPAEGAPLPAPGEKATARIDWPTRYRRMRAHTALHLLSVVLPYPVTGGAVGEGEGRLDFNSGETGFVKAEVEARLNALIASAAAVGARWISEEELAANPSLVKTMMVKPPVGQGRIRLVEIAGLDLQPCGGTHVLNVSEIGRAEVREIEKKGKLNRRVKIRLVDA